MLRPPSHGQGTARSLNRLRRWAPFLLLLPGLFAIPVGILSITGPHGAIHLVSEQTLVQPGRPIWLGLHFQLEPGWHIYWVNPGDSGEPPRVKWTLPEGFVAGPLNWPSPRRIEDHSLIDYGYQNEVLLPVQITPPARLKAGEKADLSATVNWLVCRDICVPGHATLDLAIPVGTGSPAPPSPSHPLFAKARSDLPRPAPKAWKLKASLDRRQFVLDVETGKQEAGGAFFPLEPNQLENAAPQRITPYSRGIRIELQRSDQMVKLPSLLRGVLVLSSGQGFMIEAPVITTQ